MLHISSHRPFSSAYPTSTKFTLIQVNGYVLRARTTGLLWTGTFLIFLQQCHWTLGWSRSLENPHSPRDTFFFSFPHHSFPFTEALLFQGLSLMHHMVVFFFFSLSWWAQELFPVMCDLSRWLPDTVRCFFLLALAVFFTYMWALLLRWSFEGHTLQISGVTLCTHVFSVLVFCSLFFPLWPPSIQMLVFFLSSLFFASLLCIAGL